MLSGPAFNCSVGWWHHSHRGKATNAPSWGHGPSHPAEISTVSFGTKGTSAAGAGQQRVPAGSGVCGERLAQGGPAPPWGETSSPLPQSWGCSGPPSAATALAAPPPPPRSSQPGPCSRDTRPRSLCTVPALAKLPAGSTGAAVPLLWAHAWGSPALLGTGSGLSAEHGAGWVPGAEPAPCPAASPPQGTFCPWRGTGGSRLAGGHRSSAPLLQQGQDAAVRLGAVGAWTREVWGSLPSLPRKAPEAQPKVTLAQPGCAAGRWGST